MTVILYKLIIFIVALLISGCVYVVAPGNNIPVKPEIQSLSCPTIQPTASADSID